MVGESTQVGNHLDRVLCQARFNPLFSMDDDIGRFQRMIGSEYPRSGSLVEPSLPLFPTAPAVMNYSFESPDGHWVVNITNYFITLTANVYTCWEDFRDRFEWVLGRFTECYDVIGFERVGLRYINAIRPSKLPMNGRVPSPEEILNAPSRGMMDLFDNVNDMSSTVKVDLGVCMSQCTVGMTRFNDDGESDILVDNDLFVPTYTDVSGIMSTLDVLNTEARSLLQRIVSEDAFMRMVNP